MDGQATADWSILAPRAPRGELWFGIALTGFPEALGRRRTPFGVAGASTWVPVSPASLVSFASGCVTIGPLASSGTFPTLGDLTGTPMVVGFPFVITPTGPGSGVVVPPSTAAPVVTSVTPASGPAAGGTEVTIDGTGFSGATTVNFGGAPSPHFTVASDTEITATSPAGTAGAAVDITVDTAGGISHVSAADSFAYTGTTLSTTDGAFTMPLPAGATLGVAEACTPPAGIPADTAAASCVFTLSGPALPTPEVATLEYTARALGGLPAARLSVYAQGAGGTWGFLPTAVDAVSGTVQVHVAGPGALVVLADTQRFPDVPASYWAAGYINTVAAASVVDGFPNGAFQPNAALTRAQFTKMLVVTLGLPRGTGTTRFTDVPDSAWFAPYVVAAQKAGVVDGVSAREFAPHATVTREQMAVMLARALHLTGTATLTFRDAATIAPWAAAGVQAAVAAGYIDGFPNGTLQPLGNTTRAQAAKVLAVAIGHMAP